MSAQTITTHVVQRGETLESVAKKYGISTDALKEANPDTKEYFFTGMKLIIPTKSENSHPISEEKSNITRSSEIEVGPKESVIEDITPSKSQNKTYFGEDTYSISYINTLKDGDKGCFLLGMDCYGSYTNSLGFSTRILTNIGLVDSENISMDVAFGPNLSFAINTNKSAYFVCPLLVGAHGYNKINEQGKKSDHISIAFMSILNPHISFKFCRYFGLNLGVAVSYTFVKHAEIQAAASVGLVF